jgi:hypothetical protein
MDRTNGKLIAAHPFVKVNWASHIDLKTGRPGSDRYQRPGRQKRDGRNLPAKQNQQARANSRGGMGGREAVTSGNFRAAGGLNRIRTAGNSKLGQRLRIRTLRGSLFGLLYWPGMAAVPSPTNPLVRHFTAARYVYWPEHSPHMRSIPPLRASLSMNLRAISSSRRRST